MGPKKIFLQQWVIFFSKKFLERFNESSQGGLKTILYLPHVNVWSIRYRQKILGGPRTKMKIWSEKFFRASRKKRSFQIFRLRRAFFVVEPLKTAKKPLKTAKKR